MFTYNIIERKYWISSDKIKWNFWPFNWVFVRNRYLWNIEKTIVNEKKYPWYKYSFWVWKEKIFIISENWIEKIKLNS
jgi:hypothetical protein